MISLTDYTIDTNKGMVKVSQLDNGMIIAQFINGDNYPSGCCYDNMADIQEWLTVAQRAEPVRINIKG